MPIVASAALHLAGCASYAPGPLGGGDALLAQPRTDALQASAASIDRPYLNPVQLDLTGPIDLNAVSIVTVLENPDLKAQRVRASVSDAQVFDAKLLPDPTGSLGADVILSGPDALSNLAGAIGEEINALRTRRVRVEGAAASARQVRLDVAWAEWQAAGQARLQSVRITGLARALRIARDRLASEQDLLSRNLKAAARGDVAGDQVQTARLAVFETSQIVRSSEQELATAKLELNRLMGLQPETSVKLAVAPIPPPPPSAAKLFQIAQIQRSDLRALRAGYESQEAAVHKAVLDHFANLSLSVDGNRDTSGNKLSGVSVNFTLPLWNRNRGGIAIAEATRSALRAEFESRMFQTRAEIAAAVTGIALARRQLEDAQRDLPSMERFADANQRASLRGDLSLATARSAMDTLRDKELIAAQLERSILEQTIALELLTGVPLKDWAAL